MRARLLLLLALLVPDTGRGQPASQRPEPAVKAQFFERFTRFVEWPDSPAGGPSSFTVCLAGSNELAREIQLLAGRLPFKGRPARVRQLGIGPAPEPEGCQAIYVSPSAGIYLDELIARTRGRPILTVADTPGFGQRGVMINMLTVDGYIRFEVNDAAARAARLRLSSQLLRLARLVSTNP